MTPITTNFREDIRYEYLLDANSIVVDAGAYHGDFASEITRRYGCRVYAFEPVFYHNCKSTPLITYFPVGLHSRFMLTDFAIHGNMTGRWATGDSVPVVLVNICDVVRELSRDKPIDLLKLNIEGGEYDCIDALLDAGLMPRIRNLQVQFHKLHADSEERHAVIRTCLSVTHRLTYDFPFCWENYALNT